MNDIIEQEINLGDIVVSTYSTSSVRHMGIAVVIDMYRGYRGGKERNLIKIFGSKNIGGKLVANTAVGLTYDTKVCVVNPSDKIKKVFKTKMIQEYINTSATRKEIEKDQSVQRG